jgi:uncharacterized protein
LTVAYSGGVDSAFLLAAASDALSSLEEPPPLIALTALSPSYPDWEREPARELAASLGVQQIEVETDELERSAYRANQGDRCFHCKEALFDGAERSWRTILGDQAQGAVVYGAIVDDLGDHRPGMDSARKRGVIAPLIEVGLNKSDVRFLSRERGLPTWDKPASACLASRFPYGVEVTADRLDQVGRCEARLHALGLHIVRARYHHELVRLELGEQELKRVLSDDELRSAIVQQSKEVGFRFVSIDLEGYRSGSANEALVVIQ